MFEKQTLKVKESQELLYPDGDRVFWIIALILLAMAASLRLYHLGHRSLWFDEALAAELSRGTFAEMLRQIRSQDSAPLLHPFILYIVQKFRESPAAVRAPSAVASILAVLMMVAMVRAKVSRNAVLFSMAILAISRSQIRYAQEVREYALGVLFAAILTFCLLKWESSGSRKGHPWLLYGALFLAPFVQYGLVLLAFGILSTIGLRLLLSRETAFRLSHGLLASAWLGFGGLLSLFLTLRYQFRDRYVQWYLHGNYFDAKTMSLPLFLATNTRHLLIFLIPLRLVALCFVIGAAIYCIRYARARKYEPLALLVFTSVLITMCASVVGIYPYGGIRQCLFLAPVMTLFAGVVFADTLKQFRGSWRSFGSLALMSLILFTGYRSLRRPSPYAEVENISRVLTALHHSIAQGDRVYVYYGAKPALDFYWPRLGPNFVFGKSHRDDPQKYVPDLLGLVGPHTSRIWLVFSHVYDSEEHEIVDGLRSHWNVRRVVAATGAALYVANRKPSSLQRSMLSPRISRLHTVEPVPTSFLIFQPR